MHYQIKSAAELSDQDIRLILESWQIQDWLSMSRNEFEYKFLNSEFHLLKNINNELAAVARINFDFNISIETRVYRFAELVGLVSLARNCGYGTMLVRHLRDNMKQRKMECIGFCDQSLRPFYENCEIRVLRGKAKNLLEKNGGRWIVSDDDDILEIHLSGNNYQLLDNLSVENPGILLFESDQTLGK